MPKHTNIPSFFAAHIAADSQSENNILVQKAKIAIADLTEDYIVHLEQDIRDMDDFLARAATADAETRFRLIRTDFFNKMHDMKGQGATFGYPLLTDIGTYTCDFLRHKVGISDADLTVLKTMLSDTKTVLKKQITHADSPAAAPILAHIQLKD